MKKILFVSTRDPFSGRYSGDVIRSLKIINVLKKRFHVDVVYLGNKPIKQDKNIFFFTHSNIFIKILYCFISVIKIEPIQFGLFFSKEMKKFIEENSHSYEIIFFQHIRSSQYLPKNYYGTTILDMGDLYSDNYTQTCKFLNYLNPLKYLYFIESILVRKIETQIFSLFDKILLFSKNEVNKVKKIYGKKIVRVSESIDKIHKKVLFSEKKLRILFVGNLNYLPNILACRDFIKNVLPGLNKKNSKIKFCIVGNIKRQDKISLLKNKNVEILGSQKKIEKYVKNSFCGIANLSIATGVQVKVLQYMSYGLPVICSSQVASNFKNNILTYKSSRELINKILYLKNNKPFWNKFSKKSHTFVKKFKWKDIQNQYFKITVI